MGYLNLTSERGSSWRGGIFTKLMLLPFLKPLLEGLLTALVMTSYSRPTKIGPGVLRTDSLTKTESGKRSVRKTSPKPRKKGTGFKSKANSTSRKDRLDF